MLIELDVLDTIDRRIQIVIDILRNIRYVTKKPRGTSMLPFVGAIERRLEESTTSSHYSPILELSVLSIHYL